MSDLFNDEGAKPKRQSKAKAAPKQEVLPPDDATELVAVTIQTAELVLTKPEEFETLFAKVKAATEALKPDTSTNKGRQEIRSMARKVVTTKTAIDKARLTLTKDWRDKVAAANAAGKTIEERLNELADQVRKPLTDWENAEKARIEANEAVRDQMTLDSIVTDDDTAASVEARGRAIHALVFEEPQWSAEEIELAHMEQQQAVHTLLAARKRLAKAEADAAELEQLRAAQRERDEREAAERAEREAEEAAKREAEEAAERKRAWARQIIEYIGQVGLGQIGGKTYPYVILIRELEEKVTVTVDEFGDMADDVEQARVTTLAALNKAMADQVERDRIAAEEAEAKRVEDAKREAAEQAAREAQAAADRQREADLQAERDAAAAREAEAEAERERERQANETALQQERERAAEAQRQLEAQQAAERKRIADEAAAEEERQAKARNQAHRKAVKTAMFNAIIEAAELDPKEDQVLVVKIVNALCAGDVPFTVVTF